MGDNKFAIIRYEALDKCFSNFGRNYYIEDLIEVCSNAICTYSGKEISVGRSTVLDDITFMESEASGWSVPLDRLKDGRKIFFRYSDSSFSINNSPLNEAETRQLKEAMLTISRFTGMPQFDWVYEMLIRLDSSFIMDNQSKPIVGYEENLLFTGKKYISVIYQAISNERALKIEYQGYRKRKPKILTYHPQYLKQYNNRWFVFGLNAEYEDLSNLALDRILNIQELDFAYRKSNIDFKEYFEDIVGVTLPLNGELEKVKIQVDYNLFKYIESKPLHDTQETLENSENGVIIQLEVVLNYELKSLLLSYGDGLKVLSPERLIEYFKTIHTNQLNKYS